MMEILEFLRQRKRMCDYHCGKACTHDDSSEICPAHNINCDIMTDQPEQLVAIVEKWAKDHPEKPEQERQKPEREQQKPEHPEESSDLHAIIDALEDRIDKLDEKVSNEALIFREVSKRNQDAHRQLAERIAALEKDPVESMNEPKRTNKDALLAAFPDAYIVYPSGVPMACPLSLDKHYDCSKFKNCGECGRAHWLAEAQE